MFAKREPATLTHTGPDTKKRHERRCVPGVAALEDRTVLSAAGSHVAALVANHQGPILTAHPQVAQIHSLTKHVGEPAAHAASARVRVHFPGGGVKVGRGGVYVRFPGGSVKVNRFGTNVNFPGGFVVSNFGGTFVNFPYGSIFI